MFPTLMGPGFLVFFLEDEIYAGGGTPVIVYHEIIYDTLPVKTVEKVARKVEKYKEAKRELNPENIKAIVDSMVDTWPKAEMLDKMETHHIGKDLAILSYKATLSRLIVDDDLALLLIIAST